MKRLFELAPLPFATRIALVLVASVAAVWIAAMVLFFQSQANRSDGTQPLPAQIVALVDLLERTPLAGQLGVLEAVSSPTLHASLVAGDQVGAPALRPVLRLGERTMDSYLSKLGGRRSSVTVADRDTRSPLAVPDAVEFRIALRTGQTLVIDTGSTPLVTLFGLPVGFGVGLFGTLIALVALVVLLRETRPLSRLAGAVDRIDVTSLTESLAIPPRSAPEIRALMAAFDRLQARLAHLMKARMAMQGGISHDVRTFATRLRLRMDGSDGIADPEQRRRAIGDIDDMIRLLDDALLASRAGVGELNDEMVDVEAVVRAETADRTGGDVAVVVDAAAIGATILGDRVALRRVVANLVDNAQRHGRRVELALTRDADTVVLTVDDDGPGIPVDQRELLLEPFVRLDPSRSRETGGAGLGLAVVRSLVEAHGGTLRIDDAPRGGARLLVRLPLFVSD